MTKENALFLQKLPDVSVGPITAPYGPEEVYPEYVFDGTTKSNPIYAGLREMLRGMGLDPGNFGTPRWNPLGKWISPGNTVLIKPNMVLHRSHAPGQDYYSVVTHPALIRAVADYVFIALHGRGRMIIGDAPINSADFSLLKENLGLENLREIYARHSFKLEVEDFRLYSMCKDESGVISGHTVKADMSGHTEIKMDRHSLFCPVEEKYRRFRVTEYDGYAMALRHNTRRHRYCFHKSALEADAVISLPKIKTHRKAGFTCAMKNLVGLNGNKDWLPHHIKGSAAEGGDEYLRPSLRKVLISDSWDLRWKIRNTLLQRLLLLFERIIAASGRLLPFPDPYWEGSWYGNNTIARMVGDINRALIYCDKDGELRSEPQRKILSFVDGIICGEGEGPMAARARNCGLLLFGENTYALDLLVARLIGFDAAKIPCLSLCGRIRDYPLFIGNEKSITVSSNLDSRPFTLDTIRNVIALDFEPPSGWKGHIERPLP